MLISENIGITQNTVELPKAIKDGALHIRVSGRVDLQLSFQTADGKLTQYVESEPEHSALRPLGG